MRFPAMKAKDLKAVLGRQPPGYCPVLNFAVPVHVAVDHYGICDVIAIVNDEEQRRLSFHVVEPQAN